MSGYTRIVLGALKSGVTLTENTIPHADVNGDLQDSSGLSISANGLILGSTRHLELQALTNGTLTGSLQLIPTPLSSALRLANASLVSVIGIAAGAEGQQLIIYNRSSASITIIDSSSAIGTASNRIITGTGANLTFLNDTAIIVQYDSATARWQVIGGSASGGGGSTTITANKAAVSDGAGALIASATTDVQIGYLSTLSSNAQTQINTKSPISSPTFTGTVSGITASMVGAPTGSGTSTGSNTGDQDLSGLVPKTTTVNSRPLSGNIVITQSDVGLPNVMNTSDTDKPVSTAQQTALNLKLNITGSSVGLDLGSNYAKSTYVPTVSSDLVNLAALTSAISGQIRIDPILDSHLINDALSTPPGSPNTTDLYLVSSSPTGLWSAFAGKVVRWNGSVWNDQIGRAVAIGDRFGIAFESGTVAGSFTGKTNNIATLTNATPGSYTYTFYTPVDKNDTWVNNNTSSEFGHEYNYVASSSSWVELPASVPVVDGAGLLYSGSTMNIISADSSMQINADSIQVGTGGITNTHISGSAAITYSKLSIASGDITYSKLSLVGAILNADLAAGIDAAKINTGVVSNTEFNYLDGVTSAIQTQLNSKQATLSAIYSQLLTVVASGASGSNQINGPVSPLTSISLPSTGTWTGDELEVYLNGLQQYVEVDYNFISSTQINFVDTLQVTDVVKFYKNR